MRVVIVGAGVVGLGVGWRLAQRGAHVVVCERGRAGSGASAAAAGMLAPTAEVNFEEEALLALNVDSRRRYPAFVRELEAAASMSVDYREEGTLVVGLDRDDTAALERLLAYQLELGLSARMLDGAQARALEPGLSPNVHSALACDGDHQVDPRRLVAALVAAFRAAGGVLREGVEVARVDLDASRARGVTLEGGERVLADVVLICAGAWARKLGGLPRGVAPHVRPMRGQMFSVEMTRLASLSRVVRAPDAYLVPKSDGRLIVGATMEDVGFDERLTAGGLFELLRGAWEAFPGIYDLPILETWTGFRPMTLTREPVLGPAPDVDGLWYATGHGRNGILLTPLTAALVSEAIWSGVIPERIQSFGVS